MKNTSIRHADKSKLCDSKNEQEGSRKKSEALLQSEAQNDGQEDERPRVADRRKGMREEENNQCSDISISFQAVEDSLWQPVPLEEYEQLSLWRSIPTHSLSSDITSQEFQSTQTSETTSPEKENSICYRLDFLAQARVTQEVERDYLTQNQHFGEKDLDALLKLNPASVLSNNLKELSDEDFELFLADSLWQDTITRLKQSRQQSLGRVIKDEGFLLFPTLTSGASTTTSRPAGQTKCEKWFKDNGLIAPGLQLGTQAIALTMGFPFNWLEGLTEQYSKNLTTHKAVKHQAESEPDISQEEVLLQDKQRSPSPEFSISTVLLGGEDNSPLSTENSSSVNEEISIPCLVKQPKQPEVKGVIKQDLGDCFLVDISDELITVSKLFVYPDFSETPKGRREASAVAYRSAYVGQISPTKKVAPPSKNSPTKTRRKKGDGTGYIYRRTITRRGKEYPESYFRYRDESGKVRSKYIPQKLIDKVQEAESQKKPIADILVLLGGDEISRGEQSNNVPGQTWQTQEKSDELIFVSRGEQLTPPSKRRKQGYGTGYIECKPIKRSGKKYQQYWYHYEEWREGDRLSKKSRYIPKRLLARVEKLEGSKAPVRKILEVLGMKG